MDSHGSMNSSRDPERFVMADTETSFFPSRLVLAQDSGQYFCTGFGNLFGHFLQVLVPETKRRYLRNRGYLTMLTVCI